MKKTEVLLNHVYAVKVSGGVRPVRVLEVTERRELAAAHRFSWERKRYTGGGWTGLNLVTGKKVRIATAGKLRHELHLCEECCKWTADLPMHQIKEHQLVR